MPTLIIICEGNWPCLLHNALPALAVMPDAGHTINLEDPGDYNRIVGDFLATVESGP